MTQNVLAIGPYERIPVIGSCTDSLPYAALVLTKSNLQGLFDGKSHIKQALQAIASTPLIHQVLSLSDQGYLLVEWAAC